MSHALRSATTALLLLAFSLPAGGQETSDDPGSTEGALFLLLPVGAKAVSMGRAMTAMSGVESVFWNPAGLSRVRERQVVIVRGDHVAGPGTAVTVVMARPSVGTLSASYFLLDAGSQDLTDPDGNFLGTLTVRNHLGVLSAAAELVAGLSAGANLKLVQFRQSCRGSFCQDVGTTATTYAVDGGVQLDAAEGVRLAAMVAHLGPRFQVLNAEQADPLPTRIRVAAAFDFVRRLTDSDDISGWLSVEVQDRLRDLGSASLYIGTELAAGSTDALFLRAGYVVGDLDQEDGARVGLGLRYERFDLAIAKSLAVSSLTGETEPVHVTFAIRF